MSDTPPRWRATAAALLAASLFALLHTAAFPFAFADGRPLCVSESAYLFLVPIALWLMEKRSLRATLAVSLLAGWLSWTALLFWIRHVTLSGTIVLGLFMALFPMLWTLGARLALPGISRRPAPARIGIIAALAALWVLLEWLRGHLLTGFPWLPLAASQWERPALLQILTLTGWSGLSWLLAYFNLAIASYATTIIRPRRDLVWWRRLNPELYSALFLLAGSVAGTLSSVHGHANPETLCRASLVQPYVEGTLKWDPALDKDNMDRLDRLSYFASLQEAEIIFWPESATPWPILAPDPTTRLWAESVSANAKAPIVLGSYARLMGSDREEQFLNGIFAVDPEQGLGNDWYAKEKLVPFGEYDPFGPVSRLFFEWPTAYFTSGRALGKSELNLKVPLGSGTELRIGPLLCYEDIFPALARARTLEGADFLFVATNNAWYGEEAGAYQHALHSILRAVENRRPVLRCGNGGWSGLIDEYGAIRHIATRPGEGVYFEGEDVISLQRDEQWSTRFTFYTRNGDWFVALCALFVGAAGLYVRRIPAPEPTSESSPDGISEDRRKARELLRRGKFRLSRRVGRL